MGCALGLVLAAAALHALWNLAAKRVPTDAYAFLWCCTSLSAVLVLPWALYRWWNPGAPTNWPWLVAPAVAALLHIGYGLTLQRGYQRAELGLVYPLARDRCCRCSQRSRCSANGRAAWPSSAL